MTERGGTAAFLPPDLSKGRLLPIKEVNQGPQPKSAEIVGQPILPSRFTSKEGDMSIDIYTNTLCHGSGSRGHDHHCAYCFLNKGQLTDENMMSLPQFGSILQWFTSDEIRINEKGKPRKTVSLLGGEFALHSDAKEMIKRVHKSGLNVHIVTSGSNEFRELLEDEDIVTILNDKSRDNLIAVSLDSVNEEVNDKYRGSSATRKAKSTIAKLQELEIPFRINATVTNEAIAGLTDLYDFAQEAGARKVLVHFPSPVGMAEKFDIRFDVPQSSRRSIIPSDDIGYVQGGWPFSVGDSAHFYNMFERWRPDFEVECQIGYGEAFKCPLIENTSSLQFTPPISHSNPDIPVVACGLNMAIAKTDSAYLFRQGNLFERKGNTELSKAIKGRESNPHACPLSQDTERACIYDVQSIPTEVKKIEPLRIAINQTPHAVYEFLLDSSNIPLWNNTILSGNTDGESISLGTIYTQHDIYGGIHQYTVTQLNPDRRISLKGVDIDHQVLYKILPKAEGSSEVVILEWDESGVMPRTFTQEHLERLKQVIQT